MWSGDARVLGELVEVAVRGAEMDPGIAALVEPRVEEDLHASGSQLGGRGLDVVDQESGHRAGGEVPIDIGVEAEDLDLAPVGELEHPEPRLLQLEPQAQDVTEEGDGGFCVVGSGAHPGQLDDPHGQTRTPESGSASPA
jgi:hypothetical protein